MKTKLVIVERDGKGNIIIDENEFKDFISRAYDEGFEEGKKSNGTITVGTPYPYKDKVYL